MGKGCGEALGGALWDNAVVKDYGGNAVVSTL